MNITSHISLHHHFLANMHGRDFFVGDIHGQYSLLKSILRKVNFSTNRDRVFSVGDAIDRGEDSYSCLMLNQEYWFNSVLGNHENFILTIEENNYFQRKIWNKNGGDWWWNLSEDDKKTAKKTILKNYYISLSVETEMGNIGVIHAQYPFDSWPLNKYELDDNSFNKIIWGREDILGNESKKINNIDYIICGHTPVITPKILYNKIYIDTGCGYSANEKIPNPRLTLCEFSNGHIIAHSINKYEYNVYEIN